MKSFRFTSCQSPVHDPFCDALAGYLTSRLGEPVQFVGDVDWPERERRLDQGEVAMGWICGSWYTLRQAAAAPPLQILLAPVAEGERYHDQPVYFSDVLVQRSSPYRSLADLRGTVWAYNEPNSFSGCLVMGAYLAGLGEAAAFFGQVVQSGSHLHSLRLIQTGKVDAAAVDSTVLDQQRQTRPDFDAHFRCIHSLGPNPAPPWVSSGRADPQQVGQVRNVLLRMHEDEQGRAVFKLGGMARFTSVTEADYEPVRQAVRLAQAGKLALG